MRNIYTKAGSIIALLASSLVITGCGGNSGNNPQSVSSVKSIYNLGDCTPNLEDQLVYVESENSGYVCTNGDWVKADNAPSSSSKMTSTKSSDESETTFFDNQPARAVTLSNGLTYTTESVDKCPDGWHKMTIDECKALHKQNADLESSVFDGPFEIVGKTHAEKCSAGLSNECLVGIWTLSSISRIDTKEVITDFSGAQGGVMEFREDGIYHYTRSTYGDCPDPDEGHWIIEDKTLTFKEDKRGDCIEFGIKHIATPSIEIADKTITLYLNKVIFQRDESDGMFAGNDTEVFTSDASLVEICNENRYAASIDKSSIRGIQKVRCVK